MTIEEIRNKLFEMQDLKYRDFESKLNPAIPIDDFIGVRTPVLRKLAKYLIKDECEEFLENLPHKYFEENQLHAFIISEIKVFDKCIDRLCEFLPYVNNWATCDQTSPKIFKKYKSQLESYINEWIKSEETYTVRFAVKMLMEHFLDDDFEIKYPEMVANIKSDEYYVKMMVAWYFATALAKQYDSIIIYLEKYRLNSWTHNKTIQKSVESYRISQEKKEYLKGLFETTYFRDIVERNHLRRGEELDELCNIISASSGELLNSERISNTFLSVRKSKIDKKTVEDYVGYFVDAFLLREARRYDIKGSKEIGALRKYYFTDTGLRNARLNFVFPDEGQMIENNEAEYRSRNVKKNIIWSFVLRALSVRLSFLILPLTVNYLKVTKAKAENLVMLSFKLMVNNVHVVEKVV